VLKRWNFVQWHEHINACKYRGQWCPKAIRLFDCSANNQHADGIQMGELRGFSWVVVSLVRRIQLTKVHNGGDEKRAVAYRLMFTICIERNDKLLCVER
jgi:hypothetical protein